MIRSKPWWNGEIDEKRKIMRTRWREWKDARTTPARNQFNAVRNTFYNAIREAKSKNWNDFLQGAKGKEIFTAIPHTKPRRTDPTQTSCMETNEHKPLRRKLSYSAQPSSLNHQPQT